MRSVNPRRTSLQRIEKFVGNSAWQDFVDWCHAKKLTAVPANPWTLAAYIRSLESQETISKIRKRVADIGKAHAEKSKRRPERDPLINKTFRILEIRAENNATPSRVFDDNPFRQSPAKKPTPKKPPRPAKTRSLRSSPKLVRRHNKDFKQA